MKTRGRRLLGRDVGAVRMADDFDAPLPADVLADFRGMKVLLDTHARLWMHAAPERFNDRARRLVEDTPVALFFSPARSWEIAVKDSLGQLELPEPPDVYVPTRLRGDAVTTLPVEHSRALREASLEFHHRDPFDRLLVAQALVEGLPVLSADPMFGRYDVEQIAAS